MGLISEFKSFVMKGNVLDMAVGIIIGSAFAKIVDSMVADVLMPIIGIIIGGVDFSALSLKVGEAELFYGKAIQATINFLIIAFVLFLILKAANKGKMSSGNPA